MVGHRVNGCGLAPLHATSRQLTPNLGKYGFSPGREFVFKLAGLAVMQHLEDLADGGRGAFKEAQAAEFVVGVGVVAGVLHGLEGDLSGGLEGN